MKSCDIPVLVVGNKSDAEKLVPDDKIESIQEEWGCKYLGKLTLCGRGDWGMFIIKVPMFYKHLGT